MNKNLGLLAVCSLALLNACGGGAVDEGSAPGRQAQSIRAESPEAREEIRLAAGSDHVLAVDSNGAAFSWGANSSGQLGDVSYYYVGSPFPKPVTGLSSVAGLSGVKSVAAGGWHSVAVRKDGTVWGWGYNASRQAGASSEYIVHRPQLVTGLSRVTSAAAGNSHTIALRNDGTVWGWGNLGGWSYSTPTRIGGLSGVKAISAGGGSSAALVKDGSVWAWGHNYFGELGNGTYRPSSFPTKVSFVSNAEAVASSERHMLALSKDGNVWAWGDNTWGQLGNPTLRPALRPMLVRGLSNVKSLAAGPFNSAALHTNGMVSIWGDNTYGQFGNGTSGTWSYYPAQVPGITDAVGVAVGRGYVLVLLRDGGVRAFGNNDNGQLGINSYFDVSVPRQTVGPYNSGFLNLGATR